jgi:prefoldin subunit 5
MAALIEHIQSIETEIYLMTHDGHHAAADVRAAMERLDKGVELLHAARRRMLAEGTEASSQKPEKRKEAARK